MANPPEQNASRRPEARKAPRPRRPGGSSGSPHPEGPTSFRERLRRDRFLFVLCLGFLFFATAAFALGWRVLGEPVLLLLAVMLVPPAFLLFYLRDSSPA